MNKTTLISALKVLDIPENTWTVNYDLLQVNFSCDGNFYYNFLSELIKFDTVNEIFYIKYYKTDPISSEFFKSKKVDTKKFKVETNLLNEYSLAKTTLLPKFRDPRVGDVVYTVDQNGAFAYAVEIESMKDNVLTLSEDITVPAGGSLCYGSGVYLEAIGGQLFAKDPNTALDISSITGSTNVVLSFAGDRRFQYVMKPQTLHSADFMMTTKFIDSFLLRRHNTRRAIGI